MIINESQADATDNQADLVGARVSPGTRVLIDRNGSYMPPIIERNTSMAPEYVRSQLDEELQKLEHDTDLTAASNFRKAQDWEAINVMLGLSAVGISGLVTVLGATMSAASSPGGHNGLISLLTFGSTILAAAATVVGSILTFLKPAERAARYREFGNKQKGLRNRIRVYRAVIVAQEASVIALTEQLSKFLLEKDMLNSDNPPIPRSTFRAASKEILEKRQRRSQLDKALAH